MVRHEWEEERQGVGVGRRVKASHVAVRVRGGGGGTPSAHESRLCARRGVLQRAMRADFVRRGEGLLTCTVRRDVAREKHANSPANSSPATVTPT